MLLKQYYLGCLAHASYLIGDESTGIAAVIDPRRDVVPYIEDAEREGMRIAHVILTHFHADFVAGHLELRSRVGAEVHLGARAEAEFGFTPAHDCATLDLGSHVRLRFLETPGHTPEAVSILVYDLEEDADRPHAVLTGDTLFIGDVGRPDLAASQGFTADELAGWLYDSLRDKLLPLPDATLVYPAHGAGSLCGRNLSTDTVSTMGVQRTYNHALQPMTKDEFIEIATAELPPAPSYFSRDAMLNRQESARLPETPATRPLTLDEATQSLHEGAQAVDVRDPVDFAAAHLRGSTNVGLSGQFAQWAGALLDFEQPIVLIAYPGTEDEAVTRLARVGLDNVSGYLDGGMEALERAPELMATTERITAPTLAEQLSSDRPPRVLDVRSESEWEAGHIEGSLNVPLDQLPAHVIQLPTDRPLAVMCAGGYRSSIAASVLQQAGVRNFTELVGGFGAWEASRLETAAGSG